MEVSFTKMHGTGNDFVFIEDMDDRLSLDADTVAKLCDRHFGIGADGVILVKPVKHGDAIAYMHYINSDGSLAQMCGNGSRCFAKYLVDKRLTLPDEDEFDIETLSGTKNVRVFNDEADGIFRARIDMGAPILDPALIPTKLEANALSSAGEAYVSAAPLESPWGTFSFTCISMGNPHAVFFVDDFNALPDECFSEQDTSKTLSNLDVDTVGRFFESHEAFPEKCNIEFASIHGDDIDMRVYERGCAETYACGTGSCATAVAAWLNGYSDAKELKLHLLGGVLTIERGDEGHILMTGPATTVYGGFVDIPDSAAAGADTHCGGACGRA